MIMRKFVLFFVLGFILSSYVEGADGYSFVCKTCGKDSKKYKDIKSVIAHICDKHPEKSKYKENYAVAITQSGKKNGKYECLDCSFAQAKPSLLKNHVENVHFGVCYACDDCNAAPFATESGFNRHLRNGVCKKNQEEGDKEEENFTCVCGSCGKDSQKYAYEDKESLMKHICEQHLKEEYEKNFVNTKVERNGKKYKCLVCDDELTHPSKLKIHVENKHFNIRYKCNACGELSVSFDAFQAHWGSAQCAKNQQEKPSTDGAFTYACHLCGQKSENYGKDKDSLIKHVCKMHLKEKYVDDFVGTKFKKQDKKEYVCLFCNTVSKDECTVRRHIENAHCHVGYRCDACGKISTTKSNFIQHIKKGQCVPVVETAKKEVATVVVQKKEVVETAMPEPVLPEPVIDQDLFNEYIPEDLGDASGLFGLGDGLDNEEEHLPDFVYEDKPLVNVLEQAADAPSGEQTLSGKTCEFCGANFDWVGHELIGGKDPVDTMRIMHLCQEHLNIPYDLNIQNIAERLVRTICSDNVVYYACTWSGCQRSNWSKQEVIEHIIKDHFLLTDHETFVVCGQEPQEDIA